MSDLDRLYAQNKARTNHKRKLAIISIFITLALSLLAILSGYFGSFPTTTSKLFALAMAAFFLTPFISALLRKFSPEPVPESSNLSVLKPDPASPAYENLAQLETQRKQLLDAMRRAKLICLPLALIAGGVVFSFTAPASFWQALSYGSVHGLSMHGIDNSLIFSAFGAFASYGLGYKAMTSSKSKAFRDSFKSRVIGAIVSARGLSYDAYGSLTLNDFFKIYDCQVDEWHGEDLVSGQVEGMAVCFSDFYAAKEVKTKNGTRKVPQFRGLLFVASFEKRIEGMVFVCHKDSAKLAAHGSRAKMDDARFEEFFDVYTSDQIAARYVLTPSLMARLVGLSLRLGTPINLLFEASEVCFAIETWRDHFEADLDASITQGAGVATYESEIDEMIDIAREFNATHKRSLNLG